MNRHRLPRTEAVQDACGAGTAPVVGAPWRRAAWLSSLVLVCWPICPALAESLTREQAKALTNPAASTDESIERGRKHYLRHCQNCHGKDGRALDNFDFQATDLTNPDVYLHGSSDGEIFFAIREGAGYDMPPFSQQLEDEEIWDLVNYIRSIGPESSRPSTRAGN